MDVLRLRRYVTSSSGSDDHKNISAACGVREYREVTGLCLRTLADSQHRDCPQEQLGAPWLVNVRKRLPIGTEFVTPPPRWRSGTQ